MTLKKTLKEKKDDPLRITFDEAEEDNLIK